MDTPIKVDVENDSVRFTSDGKVFVKDAIRLMISVDESDAIWDSLKKDHPDILACCENYRIHNGETMPVVDIEGLDRILNVLPGYLFGD